jgi:hypothetical protein
LAVAAAVAVALSSISAFPASAASGGSRQDPALAQYVEQIPTAGKGGERPAASPASTGQESTLPAKIDNALAREGRAGSMLKKVATSPGLGAPVGALAGGAKVAPGSEDTAKTFSLATVRSVAGVGGARLVGLLVAIALISVALAAAVFSRSAKR